VQTALDVNEMMRQLTKWNSTALPLKSVTIALIKLQIMDFENFPPFDNSMLLPGEKSLHADENTIKYNRREVESDNHVIFRKDQPIYSHQKLELGLILQRCLRPSSNHSFEEEEEYLNNESHLKRQFEEQDE
jgi:hypothetical protein